MKPPPSRAAYILASVATGLFFPPVQLLLYLHIAHFGSIAFLFVVLLPASAGAIFSQRKANFVVTVVPSAIATVPLVLAIASGFFFSDGNAVPLSLFARLFGALVTTAIWCILFAGVVALGWVLARFVFRRRSSTT